MPFQIRYIQVATLAEYLTRLLKNKWIVVSIFILKVIVFTNRNVPKVYVISYSKLNHMFAGFGWLFWIFVYILAAQISAGQAGPEFKKVRQTQQSHDLTADKKWRRL